MSCPPAELLSAYIDGESAAGEADALQAHLPGCPRCRLRLRGLRASKSALAGVESPPMPRELRGSLLELARGARFERAAGWRLWLRPAAGLSFAAAALALLLAARAGLFAPRYIFILPVAQAPSQEPTEAVFERILDAAPEPVAVSSSALREALLALRRARRALERSGKRRIEARPKAYSRHESF